MSLLLLSGPKLPSGTPPTTRLSDRFNGAAATPLASHAPDVGGAWTVHAGTIQLSGSGWVNISVTGVATVDCGVADFTAVIETADNPTPRIIFRLTDASNYWVAEYNTSTETLAIVEVVAGAPTTRASGVRTNFGGNHFMNLTVAGASATVALSAPEDTAPVVYGTMATNLSATRHGIGGTASVVITDIVVTG